MRPLFGEFGVAKNPLQSKSNTEVFFFIIIISPKVMYGESKLTEDTNWKVREGTNGDNKKDISVRYC